MSVLYLDSSWATMAVIGSGLLLYMVFMSVLTFMLQTAWHVYVVSCDDVLDRVIGCPASCGMLTGLDGASFVWATFSRPVPVWGERCCP